MQCPRPIAIQEMLVPCGHCQVCRTNKMSDWIVRITHETQIHICNYFLTLTYSDDNLPLNDNGDSLIVKYDLQLFFKRLRKRNKCRYFAVGEYGTKYGRAHYHAIIFAKKPIQYETFQQAWGKGFIHLGNVTPKSIQYVAKYILKKSGSDKDRPPPFALMSRRPGLGWHYAEAFDSRLERNYIHLNGYKKRLPRFYKDKIYTKTQKERMREKTQQDVERLYNQTLEVLRLKGYPYPFEEYAKRAEHAATKEVYIDKSKLKF